MKTLSSHFLGLRRWGGTDVASLLSWALAILALEVIGRLTTSDIGDAIALGVMVAFFVITARVHRRRPLVWLRPLTRAVGQARRHLLRFDHEFGIDFRRKPAVPSAAPGFLVGGCLGLAVIAVITVAFRSHLPGDARGAVIEFSYCAYLIALAFTWLSLLIGSVVMLAIPLVLIHDYLVRRTARQGAHDMRREGITLLAVSATLLLLSQFLPRWTPLLIVGVATAACATLLLMPGPPYLAFLWRQRRGPVYQVGCGHLLALQLLVGTLFIVSMVMISLGDRLFVDVGDDGAMILTPKLGLCFSWLAAAGTATLAWYTSRFGAHRIRFEAARRQRPSIRLVTPIEKGAFRTLRATLRRGGVRLLRADQDGFGLPVRTESRPTSDDPFAPVRWPLPIDVAAPLDPATISAIRRRHERVLRRQLLFGLSRVFRAAEKHPRERGEGWWLAPQHWFVSGLTRDENKEELDLRSDCLLEDPVGPTFEQTLSWPARVHFADITRALDIDLMFIEDGVDFPRLSRVLENLFELHDIFGGAERAEEKHFVGLPGVRVVMHDFEFDQPYRSTEYPEPEYEDIARARILHVFLDRGEAFEPWDFPLELEDLPIFHGS